MRPFSLPLQDRNNTAELLKTRESFPAPPSRGLRDSRIVALAFIACPSVLEVTDESGYNALI